MRFFNTPINSFSDVTYGHLAIGIVLAAAIIGYVVYNVIKSEKRLA